MYYTAKFLALNPTHATNTNFNAEFHLEYADAPQGKMNLLSVHPAQFSFIFLRYF